MIMSKAGIVIGMLLLWWLAVSLALILKRFSCKLFIYIIRLNMLEAIKNNWARYLTSSLISFSAGFLGYMLLAMEQAESWSDVSFGGLVLGGTFFGVRLVVKLIVELLASIRN